MIVSPFFIIGNPRSGTSLFRIMMNANSKITVPPESGFALWLAKKYSKANIEDADVITMFVEDVMAAKKIDTWGVNKKNLKNKIYEKKPANYVELTACVYFAYAEQKGKKPTLVGDKNNYYIWEVEDLLKVFPESKIIYIVRDGRDVACSYKELMAKKICSKYKPKLSCDVMRIAAEWVDSCEKIINNRNENSIVIKYEDLISNPRDCLPNICGFLGIEFEEKMLNYVEYNDEPEEFLQWKMKTKQEIDVNTISRYKRDLSSKDVNSFERIAKEMLRTFGYL